MSLGVIVALPVRLVVCIAALSASMSTLYSAGVGTLMGFGDNSSGQIAVPDSAATAVQISAGYQFSLALTSDGRVFAWGDNAYGQTNVPPDLTNVAAIAAGGRFGVALKANGQIVAWGDNGSGQTNVPPDVTNAVAIAAGFYHVLALLPDGTVRAWGFNRWGQTNVPPGLSNITAIAAGLDHSIALTTNRTVIGWGSTMYGQLPPPADLTNVISIAAGIHHSLALCSDGTVRAWGNNVRGQIDVPVGLLAREVSGGANHSLAIKRDGRVMAWGENLNGQTNLPPALVNVVGVTGGGFHTLVLTASPLITKQPQSHIVAIGSAALLDVAGTSSGPITCQWRFGTADLVGETNAAFSLSNIQFSDAGAYSVLLSDPFGSASSAAANLTVVDPPHDQSVLAGRTATFHATSSSSAVTYQWLFNGTNLPAATNMTLGIPNAQAANAGPYSVIIRDPLGTSATFPATLAVTPSSPTIVSPPTSQTVPAGTNVAFSATAVGQEPFFYQWRINGVNIFGATNPVLTLTDVQSPGSYTVLVSNAVGSVESDAALLTIMPSAPWIEFQPADQFIPQTMRFELNVVARGSSPRTYQWRCNGTNLPAATNANLVFQEIQLYDAGIYSVSISNAYGQIVSREARLTIVPTPAPGTVAAWGDNSSGQSNGNGATNIIAIAAAEVHTLGIRSNGTVVAWGNNSQGQSNIPAGLSNVVAVAAGWLFSVALRRDGTVAAWGWNAGGQVNVPPGLSNVVAISVGNSCTAALRGNGTVVVWGACSPAQLDVPPTVSEVIGISMGNGYCLALRSDGTVLEWGGLTLPGGLTNIVALSSGTSHSAVAHSLALRRDGTVVGWGGPAVPTGLNNIASIAAGGFHCLARRSNGTVVAWGESQYGQTNVPSTLRSVTSIAAGSHSSFALTRQIVITTHPADQYVPVGTNVTFRVFASGTPAPRYQWRFNGVVIPAATNSSFTITNTQPQHDGYYNVDVWNTSGVLPSRAARLWLIPKITAQPRSQVITAGQPLALTLSVSGTPPFTFTWFRNNSWAGETAEPLLLFDEIQPRDAGIYSVIVENDAGSFYSVGSDSVTIEVIPPLEFEKSANDLTLMWQQLPNTLMLQFTTNLAPPVTWIDVPAPTNSIIIPLTSPQRFYRLTPNR